MSYRDFDAWLEEQRSQPAFTIGGETYTGRKRVPWQGLNRYLLSLDEDSDGIERTKDFFRLVLVRNDRERFVAAMEYDGDDEERVLASEQIGKLLDWLMGLYTGKAKSDDASSSPAQPSAGAPSNVVSLAPKAS